MEIWDQSFMGSSAIYGWKSKGFFYILCGKREVRLDNYYLILFTFASATLITFEKTFATL